MVNKFISSCCKNLKTFVLHVPLDGLLVESELPRHLVHEPDRGWLLQEERHHYFLHTIMGMGMATQLRLISFYACCGTWRVLTFHGKNSGTFLVQ